MKKYIYLFGVFLIFITGCQQNEVLKTHGIAYLKKREKLIIVNVSNKNDTIQIFGHPSTKGMTNDNLWIYIERTLTRGKLTKLGKNYPYFKWHRNAGYGTAEHRHQIQLHGITRHHRKSFEPIKTFIQNNYSTC